MGWVSSEVVSVVYYLMPGFIAAWIFYGLTGHERATPFERVVQALILTVIIRVLTIVVREGAFLLGAVHSLGTWTEDVGLAWSVALAFAVGLGYSVAANNDFPHGLFRSLNKSKWAGGKVVTMNTAEPTEWYGAFAGNQGYVTLHLEGERRLLGWPAEWPNRPDAGHFVIRNPHWLLDSGESVPLHNVRSTLIPAQSVEMVEFLLDKDQSPAQADLDESNRKLALLHQKKEGGKRCHVKPHRFHRRPHHFHHRRPTRPGRPE